MPITENWIKLEYLTIKGWRSIKELEEFRPAPVNVLIGPNGAGKSNFITFFQFLSYMLQGKLQERITYLGGPNDILFDFPIGTEKMEAQIGLRTQSGLNEYRCVLQFAKPNRLFFAEEEFRFCPKGNSNEIDWSPKKSGHIESELVDSTGKTASTIRNLLKQLIVYQFHNTSDTAAMRLSWSSEDGRHLKANAQNLGSFLHRIQQQDSDYYVRIRKYVQHVLPFFDDFELYVESQKVLLRWREKGTDKVFNAGQASDGMLRTIALIALLAQNPDDLPAVMFLDEPELGLHPKAISMVAELIIVASEHCQIFLSTQSVSMVDNFVPDDLVVIERKGRSSEYYRPSTDQLEAYIGEFSTAELWEHNIIGGRP